jgi:hypothetical protein
MVFQPVLWFEPTAIVSFEAPAGLGMDPARPAAAEGPLA